MSELTARQKSRIRDLLKDHPEITTEHVNALYWNCYMYGWKIYIETKAADTYSGNNFTIITHCDHRHTAKAKVLEIRAYVALLRAGQS